MFKIDGDLEVTIADAYVTEAKFPAKAGEINNRNEYVQVFYDVVVLLKDAEGNTDTWHGEISNRTGTGTYAHMYRLDLTLKTLQDIGFNVRSLQELEQQFVANEKRDAGRIRGTETWRRLRTFQADGTVCDRRSRRQRNQKCFLPTGR